MARHGSRGSEPEKRSCTPAFRLAQLDGVGDVHSVERGAELSGRGHPLGAPIGGLDDILNGVHLRRFEVHLAH